MRLFKVTEVKADGAIRPTEIVWAFDARHAAAVGTVIFGGCEMSPSPETFPAYMGKYSPLPETKVYMNSSGHVVIVTPFTMPTKPATAKD